jgi:glucosamine--fructose-6-phosphate aminotransferase (isomerizing)
MCGIVGYIGAEEALPIVMEGLRRLEYRGYDSAGIAVIQDGDGVAVSKRAGKVLELEKALDEDGHPAGTLGMGHTRWATHGVPNDLNAHPHLDCHDRVAVIHNGIIENFHELRDRLQEAGHVLRSDTDTEVVAHLIEERLRDGSLGLADAVRDSLKDLTGAYALVVVSADEPGMIVGAKVSSPLVVGFGDGENLLASAIPALLTRTRRVYAVEENQVVELRRDSVRVTDLEGNELQIEPFEVDYDLEAAEKGGYEDFMLKEIYEQPDAVRDTLRGRTDSSGRLTLDELHMREEDIRAINKVNVIACGTAYHSGLVAKYAIEHWTRLPVEIEIASEFRYRDPVLDHRTLTLAVSQSGETIDTLEALRWARKQESWALAITNTVGSAVARESDGILYTHAGPEIGVAATKTFATQMVALHLVALYLTQVRGTKYGEEIREIVQHMHALPGQVERALQLDEQLAPVAERWKDRPDVLFIGRHTGYPAALEGALKLKEISYIHAEGFAAGELKHGPIALIEDGVPVVAIATKGYVQEKMLSNIQEVRARGADVLAIATEGDDKVEKFAQQVLYVPETPELLSPVVVSVPLQLLAYRIAKLRGADVDQPRNLAKSVTVE